MNLKERIKEIEKISKRKGFDKCEINQDMHPDKSYDMGRADGKVFVAEKALPIIQELQNKNKELEAKLKELNNDK